MSELTNLPKVQKLILALLWANSGANMNTLKIHACVMWLRKASRNWGKNTFKGIYQPDVQKALDELTKKGYINKVKP